MSVKNGQLLTTSLAQYLIPTSLDIPKEVGVDFVEEPYDTGPYGAKGLAEHSLNSTTPAIVNAICNALDIDLNSIPVRPENIIRALNKTDNTH
jgi:carbon-monoxide dehydrogenase large subunit